MPPTQPQPQRQPPVHPTDYFRFFTPYTFVAALALYFSNPAADGLVADAIRAAAAFVAVAVAYVHMNYSCGDGIRRFYAHVFPKGMPHAAMVATEVAVHFLPPLLVGPPGSIVGVALGYAVVAAWYATARPSIQWLYVADIPVADYDRILYRVLPIAGAAWSAALLAQA